MARFMGQPMLPPTPSFPMELLQPFKTNEKEVQKPFINHLTNVPQEILFGK